MSTCQGSRGDWIDTTGTQNTLLTLSILNCPCHVNLDHSQGDPSNAPKSISTKHVWQKMDDHKGLWEISVSAWAGKVTGM